MLFCVASVALCDIQNTDTFEIVFRGRCRGFAKYIFFLELQLI